MHFASNYERMILEVSFILKMQISMIKAGSLRSLCLTFAMIITMALFPVSAVKAEETDTFDVGMLEFDGYATQSSDGTFTGANVEFTYKIAQYANKKVNIHLYKSGQEEFDALENGTVDTLCNVFKTPDRVEKYLFSEREVGNLSMSIFCREDDGRFTYNNVNQLQSIIVGAESGTKVKDSFLTWCTQHDVSPTIRQYDNLAEIEKALNAKEIDVGIYGAPVVEGYQTIGTFSSQPYYFVYQQSSVALKKQIDDAMTSILSEDPLYRNKLFDKYVRALDYHMEALTTDEKLYIQARSNVKVAVLANDQPYYAKDKKNVISGIIPDFYNKLAVLTGLSFTFVEYPSEETAVNAVLSGEADVLSMYSDGQISAYNKGLRVTSDYANVDAVLVTRSGAAADSIKKIAVKKRTINAIQSGELSGLDAELVGYNSAAECFEALKKGDVNAMICGQPSANWLINQSNVSSYSMTTISSNALEITGALAYSSNTLCTILSKAITASASSFNEIATENTLPSNDLKAAITRMSPAVMLTISCTLIAMVIILIWAIMVILKHQKEKNVLLQQKTENDRKRIELAAMEKQTEEKNQFFSNISHDMRTPLNAIIGFADIASEDAVAPRTKEYLAKIKTSGQLLNDLINDTLTISKVNSGKMILQTGPTRTDEIFDAVYYPIQEMAKTKGVTFVMDRSECSARWIDVDALNLEKVLLNLLTNAVKYTPKGGKVEFIVRILAEDGGVPETVFIVRDNGIGISKEFLPHIYEPFLQEDNSGGQANGTGLGLSIVKNFVDMMHGTIDVESVKNQGTTFTVHFHFTPVNEMEEPEICEKTSVDLKGRKVLLVEDNALNREIATELLQRQGMYIDTAVNGKDGLEKYEQSPVNGYDVILMDIRMPVMNGLDSAKAIRNCTREDAKKIPIIALTANAFEDDVQECQRAGMNAHIAKPIEPDVMFHTIATAIQGS